MTREEKIGLFSEKGERGFIQLVRHQSVLKMGSGGSRGVRES
jgi:hypothetical protein